MPWWDLGGSRARETGEWDTDRDSERREMSSSANDGIISSAAVIQGLLSAGATGQEAFVGVLALTVVGMLSAAGGQYGEAAAERASQLAIIESETERLAHTPDEEFAELVAHYRGKGLSEELSYAVAKELHEKDALAAQLDTEFDIDEPPSRSWPFTMGAKAGIAFALGSLGPLLLFLIMPPVVRGEVTVIVVTLSLIFSGWIGSRNVHGSPLASIGRTVTIGLVTLGISTLAGSLVTF